MDEGSKGGWEKSDDIIAAFGAARGTNTDIFSMISSYSSQFVMQVLINKVLRDLVPEL